MRISLTMKKQNKWTTYLFSLPLFSIRSPVIIHQRTIDYRFSLVSYVCIRVIVNTPSSNINNRRSKLATQSIKIDPFASFGQEIPHSGFDVKVEQQQQIGSIADYNSTRFRNSRRMRNSNSEVRMSRRPSNYVRICSRQQQKRSFIIQIMATGLP